jgi:hypothetical protein
MDARIRSLLAQWPATVVAERIGWNKALTVLEGRVRQLRPLFGGGVDPADRDRVLAG